jgi:DNA polymerase III delta prime subunit
MKLLVEDFRPQTIDDCILPDRIKSQFNEYKENFEFPNMILEGGSGTGKTTLIKAFCTELDIDYLFINGSKDVSIDILRNQITNFATRRSLVREKKMKAIIFDEADYMSGNHVQPALRGMIEQYSKNVRFFFTCNYANRLIPAIHSRCKTYSFAFDKSESSKMMKEFAQRVLTILNDGEVEYDKKVVGQFIKKHFPDMRKVLNELQPFYSNGKIDSSLLTMNVTGTRLNELFEHLKAKKYTQCLQWLEDNQDLLTNNFYHVLYNQVRDSDTPLKSSSIPSIVELISEFQRHHAFVASPVVHLAGFITHFMHIAEYD